METESLLNQQLPSAYRNLQPQASQAIQHNQHSLGHHTLASQAGLDLSGLDEHDPFHPDLRLQDPSGHPFQTPNPFNRAHTHQSIQHQVQNGSSPHTPHQHNGGGVGQFGILTAGLQHNSIGRLQHEEDIFGSPDGSDQNSIGHLSTKIVPDPPNLAEWRQKLFNVDEMITLSKDEFETYFPHVDNVYSHRSTQKYKRKPFVSHYWDCRLKGRPPGTPKSDDPNKKKRKRTARERDLCDVKIKITEYFPGAYLQPGFTPDGGPDPAQANNFFAQGQPGGHGMQQQQQQFGMPLVQNGLAPDHPGATGQRYYTIQRVNGNGGNGKGDGVAGPHKHGLVESDRVKKNSVQRFLMKKDKEEKKTQKTYHKKASGNALTTVRKHSKDHELKLFGSCFCPFVQRVWIALEVKGFQYQYIEVDPYKKPQALLEVNPRGLVPGIRHGDWGCGESTVLMEYLEDLALGQPLLPIGNHQLRANCRLWSDHINRKIVPLFYSLLQAQDFPKQAEETKKLQDEISKIVEACDPHGPFFLGQHLSFVDVQFAPWMIRFTKVLKHYRGWPDPTPGSRWGRWMDAIENNEHVKNTTSLDELYIDSYERYSQNRPNTSELADAVNGGYSLP